MPRAEKSNTSTGTTCTICNRSFRGAYELRRHMNLHADNVDELKLRCPYEGCEYRSLQEHNLKTHINAVHERKKSYKCVECEASFADNSAKIRHERRHGIFAKKGKKLQDPLHHKALKRTTSASAEGSTSQTPVATAPSPAAPSSSSSSSPSGSSVYLPSPVGDLAAPFLFPIPPFPNASNNPAMSTEGRIDAIIHTAPFSVDSHSQATPSSSATAQEELLLQEYLSAYGAIGGHVQFASQFPDGLCSAGEMRTSTDAAEQVVTNPPMYDAFPWTSTGSMSGGSSPVSTASSWNFSPTFDVPQPKLPVGTFHSANTIPDATSNSYADFDITALESFAFTTPPAVESNALTMGAFGIQNSSEEYNSISPAQLYTLPDVEPQTWAFNNYASPLDQFQL